MKVITYMRPKVSVLIPTFNHLEDCLKPCLESIFMNTDMSNKELIIIANGCTDGTVEYVKHLQTTCECIKLVEHDEPLGYTRATNLGILNSSGEYVVFLNNDTVLLDQQPNQWIDILLMPFEESTSVGITGPLALEAPGNWPFIVFFCAATPRRLINQIGILDESFSPGGCEDMDYCIRLQKKGYKTLVVPHTNLKLESTFYSGGFPIYHRAEATVHGIDNWTSILEGNKQKLLAKHGLQ